MLRDGGHFRVHEALRAEGGADAGLVDRVARTFAIDKPDGDGAGELLFRGSQRGGKGFGGVDLREDDVGVFGADQGG